MKYIVLADQRIRTFIKYIHVYEDMEEANVAVKLDVLGWMNDLGETTDEKDFTCCKVIHDL